MGLNDTPNASRVHIGIFGLRNAGKSSVINAITNQEISVVSDVAGTTTDPVQKAMELLPIGPVLLIDTPGYDDEGYLGEKRVERTKRVLQKTDVALLVVDGTKGMSTMDEELVQMFESQNIPYMIVYNKADLMKNSSNLSPNEITISAVKKEGIWELKERIIKLMGANMNQKHVLEGIITPHDIVVLVIPIDSAAPKGRLILPEQLMIREVIDAGAVAIVARDTQLEETLRRMLPNQPNLVITDSQVFHMVQSIVPESIKLTSFSILMARYKGLLQVALDGVRTIDELQDGDTILISEGCTHHRQCEDIGTVKLPRWLNQYTKKKLQFEYSSGTGFVPDLTKYRLIIHCGGCMINEREMSNRIKQAKDVRVPITNYGITIAYMNGILERATSIL